MKTWTIQAVRVHSPAERHLELVELIRGKGQMMVNQLSSHFGVSGDTVRRDLDLSANQGLLARSVEALASPAIAIARAFDESSSVEAVLKFLVRAVLFFSQCVHPGPVTIGRILLGLP